MQNKDENLESKDSKKEKKKKEKVKYYDDNSTIADMSGLRETRKFSSRSDDTRYHATEKEKLHTFFEAFKMMLVPCAIALFILLILYLLFVLIGNLAQ